MELLIHLFCHSFKNSVCYITLRKIYFLSSSDSIKIFLYYVHFHCNCKQLVALVDSLGYCYSGHKAAFCYCAVSNTWFVCEATQWSSVWIHTFNLSYCWFLIRNTDQYARSLIRYRRIPLLYSYLEFFDTYT
jgi:hypothetical protein